MKLSLVTVALDPESGHFPPDPLAGVQGEVLSVVEHFFHFGGLPQLLLVVHHRAKDTGGRKNRSRRSPGSHAADGLGPEEQKRYEALRAWRRGRAEADGVPVFVICNNRQLAAIASLRPTTKQALRQVEGIGEAKAGRYGAAILAIVANHGPSERVDSSGVSSPGPASSGSIEGHDAG